MALAVDLPNRDIDHDRQPIPDPQSHIIRGMFVSAILAAAGRGTRLGAAAPKQMLMLGDRTILQHSFDVLDRHDQIEEIVIALPPDLAVSPPAYLVSSRKPVRIVDGGTRRQDSVANAFAQVSKSASMIVIHDAARPFATADLFTRVIAAAERGGAAIAALQASDTVKEATEAPGLKIVARTIVRESIYMAQTPQAFSRDSARGCDCPRAGKLPSSDRRGVIGRGGRPLGAAG